MNTHLEKGFSLDSEYYKLSPSRHYIGGIRGSSRWGRISAAKVNKDLQESNKKLKIHEKISKKNTKLIQKEQRKLLSLLGKEAYPDYSLEKSLFAYNYPGFCYKVGGIPRAKCSLLESKSRKIIHDMDGKFGVFPCPATNLITDSPSLTEVLSTDPKLLIILCDLRTTAALLNNRSLFQHIIQNLLNSRLVANEKEVKIYLKNYRRHQIVDFFQTLKGNLNKSGDVELKKSLAFINFNNESAPLKLNFNINVEKPDSNLYMDVNSRPMSALSESRYGLTSTNGDIFYSQSETGSRASSRGENDLNSDLDYDEYLNDIDIRHKLISSRESVSITQLYHNQDNAGTPKTMYDFDMFSMPGSTPTTDVSTTPLSNQKLKPRARFQLKQQPFQPPPKIEDFSPELLRERQREVFEHLRKIIKEIQKYDQEESVFWNLLKAVSKVEQPFLGTGTGEDPLSNNDSQCLMNDILSIPTSTSIKEEKEKYDYNKYNKPKPGGFTWKKPTQIKDTAEFSPELANMREYLYTGLSNTTNGSYLRGNTSSSNTDDSLKKSGTRSSENTNSRGGSDGEDIILRKREQLRDLAACPCYTKSLRRVSCKACKEKLNRILQKANREYERMEKGNKDPFQNHINFEKRIRTSEREIGQSKMHRGSHIHHHIHYKSFGSPTGRTGGVSSLKNEAMSLSEALISLNPRKSLPALAPLSQFSGISKEPPYNYIRPDTLNSSTSSRVETVRKCFGSIFDPTITSWTLKISRLDLMKLAHEISIDEVDKKVNFYHKNPLF